ncbi:MAG: aldo/keto reductase [Chloroflexi bacterium]|nr:aldo/keto reductase [Chloroflexota bacterium]
MEYRQLGTTGVRVSTIAYGTFPLGTYADTAAGVRMIHAAMDRGMNFIDTANVYFRGRSEEIVGAALKGRRHEVVLASKFGHPMGEGPNERGASRYHINHEIEGSLRRLQTDCIDVYYIHIPDPTTPLEETLRAMDDLVRQGKVRYLGTSHFAAWQIVDGLRLAERNGLTPWVVEQPRYCLIDRAIEQEVVPMAQDLGIGIVAHSPLGGGFLTGKYKPGEPPPPDSRFASHPGGITSLPQHYDLMMTEPNVAVVDTVRALAREHDTTPSAIALAWVMAQPFVSSAIIGPKNPYQLEDNLAAADVTLTPEDLARLDAVSAFARSLIRT